MGRYPHSCVRLVYLLAGRVTHLRCVWVVLRGTFMLMRLACVRLGVPVGRWGLIGCVWLVLCRVYSVRSLLLNVHHASLHTSTTPTHSNVWQHAQLAKSQTPPQCNALLAHPHAKPAQTQPTPVYPASQAPTSATPSVCLYVHRVSMGYQVYVETVRITVQHVRVLSTVSPVRLLWCCTVWNVLLRVQYRIVLSVVRVCVLRVVRLLGDAVTVPLMGIVMLALVLRYTIMGHVWMPVLMATSMRILHALLRILPILYLLRLWSRIPSPYHLLSLAVLSSLLVVCLNYKIAILTLLVYSTLCLVSYKL